MVRFNPLSPRGARATIYRRAHNSLWQVSILSRPEGREQPGTSDTSTSLYTFQSSLAPRGESNPPMWLGLWRSPGFNPLSPRGARATLLRQYTLHMTVGFNPL